MGVFLEVNKLMQNFSFICCCVLLMVHTQNMIYCSQRIEKIAWDASGERLAVSFKEGDELYQGLIAIYDVRRTPLIAASLV